MELNYRHREVAARLGVSEPTLQKPSQKSSSTSSQLHTIHDQQDELRKLKHELIRVNEERDILNETSAYLAADSKRSTPS